MIHKKNRIYFLFILFAFYSCSKDLEVNTYGRLTGKIAFSKPAGINGTIANLYYESLATVWWWYLFPVEINSDALVMPSRPSHWEDGGVWMNLQRHKIPATVAWPINETYGNLLQRVALANKVINDIKGIAPNENIAEARVIRAYMYLLLLDLYRNVPLVTEKDTSYSNIGQADPKTLFAYIETELKESSWALKSKTNSDDWFPRLTWGAAKGLLARLYLNAEVYTGVPKYNECLEVCDTIIASGRYKLHVGDFYDLFSVHNRTCIDEMLYFMDIQPETMEFRYLLWVQCSLDDGFQTKYKIPYGMYGGLSIEPHFYKTFEDGDIRKYRSTPDKVWSEQGILVGPQYNADGTPMYSAKRNAYIIYDQIDSLRTSSFFKGAKINKFEPDQNGTIQNESHNGYPVVRYADILLMKAECLIRKSGPNDAADGLVNQIRARCFNPAKPLSNVTLDMLFDERGREFVEEGLRRMDQIRFGKWVNYGEFIDGIATPHGSNTSDGEFSKIWPIPQTEILKNPKLLKQNPGY